MHPLKNAVLHALLHAVPHSVSNAIHALCCVLCTQGAVLQLSMLEGAHGGLTQTLGPSRLVGEMELLRTIGGFGATNVAAD